MSYPIQRRTIIPNYKNQTITVVVEGDGGGGSDVSLPISSSDVVHNGNESNGQRVDDILDNLLYTDLKINGFTSSIQTYELGVTVTSLAVSWNLNRNPDAQSISGDELSSTPTLLITDRSATLAVNNATDDFTVTLSVQDTGEPAIEEDLNIAFKNGVYWGVSPIPGTVNSAFILSMSSKVLSDTKSRSFTLNIPTGSYGWYFYPVRLGSAAFKTFGFNGGFTALQTVSFTNSEGYTEDYYYARTENPGLGQTPIEVI